MVPNLSRRKFEGEFEKKVEDMSSESVSEYVPKARVMTGCSAIDSNQELSSFISTLYERQFG